jgi:hypothetical protein
MQSAPVVDDTLRNAITNGVLRVGPVDIYQHEFRAEIDGSTAWLASSAQQLVDWLAHP